MPASCPGDPDYDAGQLHTAEEIEAAFSERRNRPRGPDDPGPNPSAGPIAAMIALDHRQDVTLIEDRFTEDADGLPLGVERVTSRASLGVPAGQPMIRDHFAAINGAA